MSALHHQWRTAARIVMILLSVHGWPPAEIAGFLHYHPGTVRRWIARHELEGLTGLPDRPRTGRPRIGGPRLGQRIRALLQHPKAWTLPRIWRALGRPKMSLSTLRQRVGEQARSTLGHSRRIPLFRYPRIARDLGNGFG
nr:helix-turn-helix domain-containing protein [Allorhizocola rhizosphaerae]